MLKVNKNQVILFLYTSFLMLVSFTAQNLDNTFLLSVAAIPVVAAVILNAVKNQNWLYVSFTALAAEVYYIVVLWTFVIKGTETSWRVLYGVPAYNEISMRYALMSILIICLVYILMQYKESHKAIEITDEKINVSKLQKQLFMIVYGITIVYYLLKLPTMGTRVYSDISTIMIQSLFRACCLLGWIILMNNKVKRDHLLIIECLVGGAIALILSIAGYRFIIVENVFMLAMLNLSKLRKITMKTWILIIILALGFYVLLIYIKLVFTGYELSMVLFNHEKNIYYSFNAIIVNMGEERLATYLSTLKNLLPKALTGSTDVNTASMLMRYINYEEYLATGVNMGAYYLTEAYANFGAAGVYVMSFVFGIVFSVFERMRKGNPKYRQLFMCVYYGIVSQVWSVVYYGSANYVKFLVYYIIFAFVIVMPIKLAASKGGKKYVRKNIYNS